MRFLFLSSLFVLLCGCSAPQTTPTSLQDQSTGGAQAAALSVLHDLSVISSVDNGVAVWSLDQGKERFRLSHQGEGSNTVGQISLGNDGLYAVTSDREAFALWDLTVGEPVGFWRVVDSSIRGVAVSKKGHAILVGQGNGNVLFINPKTGRRVDFMGHSEKINSVDLSPNGWYGLTGGNDYQALLWDTRNAQVIYRFAHDSRVSFVKLDSQGRFALTADSKDDASIWDLSNGQRVSQLRFNERQKILTAAAFSADGRYLVTGSPSRRVDVWSVATGQRIAQFKVGTRDDAPVPSAVVYAVDFVTSSVTQLSIVSISSSGFVEYWDVDLTSLN